jgi:hypothetical protein
VDSVPDPLLLINQYTMLGSNESGDVIISPQSVRPRLDNRNIGERPRSSPDLKLSFPTQEISM